MSDRRIARRLRVIGVVVLVLGIAGAEVVCVRGSRSGDLPEDPSVLGYDKTASRQAAAMYGQEGVVVQDWVNDLKNPRTQAAIIILAAAFGAGGCFYFARLLEQNAQL